jgi:ADP-ribose pyrophosphatase YjhB (NUDIX family)
MRFTTIEEVANQVIEYESKINIRIVFGNQLIKVIKAYPKISWPEDWAWKDSVISDNSVHPVARESIYRSIHRLVSKVIIRNDAEQILLAKVKRGHFTGFWTLPGGYMDHDEHPSIGCVRETMEELGIKIHLNDIKPVITQKIFNDEGISFVSFTYQATWNGDISQLVLQTEEIEEALWFNPKEALENAVSFFDSQALQATL